MQCGSVKLHKFSLGLVFYTTVGCAGFAAPPPPASSGKPSRAIHVISMEGDAEGSGAEDSPVRSAFASATREVSTPVGAGACLAELDAEAPTILRVLCLHGDQYQCASKLRSAYWTRAIAVRELFPTVP